MKRTEENNKKEEFYKKFKNPQRIEELVEKIISEVELQDIENLIISKTSTLEVQYHEFYIRNPMIVLRFSNRKVLRRSGNSLELFLEIDQEENIIPWDIITVSRKPNRRGLSTYLDSDRVEGMYDRENHLIMKGGEDVRSVIKYFMLRGYSVFGDNWGHITKLGKKARGKLASVYGEVIKKDNRYFYFARGRKTKPKNSINFKDDNSKK